VQGDPGNARDGVYARIGDQAARDSVTVNFSPVKDSRIGELAARFDIVLGVTPHDDHAH
jgi:protocatechuate 3,4-dioxygenase beta subunit